MNEPLPPLNPDPPQESWWKGFAARNQWYIDKAVLVLIGVVIAWGSYEVQKLNTKTESLKHSADTAAVKADEAVTKADAVQTTALKNQVATEKLVVNATGDPKDEKALADSKAALQQHIAATQAGK